MANHYETHLTLAIASPDTFASIRAWAERHAMKWTHILLDGGLTPSQPMVTFWGSQSVEAVIVPWRHNNLRYDGTVQIDFVFGEVMPTAAVTTDVKIDGFPPVRVMTASREQSLAWKLLWLASDSYAMGKDLYDAVILAEEVPISAETLRATFLTDMRYGAQLLRSFDREQILKWRVEWDDFIKEYPGIDGTADQWRQRLAEALGPLLAELEMAPGRDAK